ncbi:ETX/MTX2 family pore-forming toxin [Streptomyces californicus]|uniref:ETX/MTX2 family pore-forming toxin n=1 Tax=Streptomyces californicus TaxID=67351 RepID=UPI0033C9EEBB
MPNLEIDEIVRAWAERKMIWHDRTSGNSVLWIAAQEWDTSKSDYLKKWQSERLREAGPAQIQYDHSALHLSSTYTFLDSRELDNLHASTTLKSTVEISKEISDSIEFSFTFGTKLGIKASGEAGVPLVANGKVEASFEFSFGVSRKSTGTTKQEYKIIQPVEVPPYRRTEVDLSADMSNIEVPFTATVPLTGGVVVQFAKNVPIDSNDPNHRLWFVSIEDIVRDLQAFNFTPKVTEKVGTVDITGYRIVPGGVIASGGGQLRGSFGGKSRVTVKEYDSHGKLMDPPVSYADNIKAGD